MTTDWIDRARPETEGLRHSKVTEVALLTVAIVAAVAALRLGATLLLPIVAAWLISQLLAPLVRGLTRLRWPAPVAAAFVIMSLALLLTVAAAVLVPPAASWIDRAPKTWTQVERKVRRLVKPLERLERAAATVESATAPTGPETVEVQVARPRFLARLSSITVATAASVLSVTFLSFFLLAAGPLFRNKLAAVLPTAEVRAKAESALLEVETLMSRYLLLTTFTCFTVGAATAIWQGIIGMPNPALWGVLAMVLNFIPYVGAVVTMTVLGIAGLVSFDGIQHAALAVLGFGVINLLESNVLTPTLLGRKLPLNAVAMFIGFLFWGWVWGVPGAILAVPLTVLLKLACDQTEVTRPLAVFLDS